MRGGARPSNSLDIKDTTSQASGHTDKLKSRQVKVHGATFLEHRSLQAQSKATAARGRTLCTFSDPETPKPELGVHQAPLAATGTPLEEEGIGDSPSKVQQKEWNVDRQSSSSFAANPIVDLFPKPPTYADVVAGWPGMDVQRKEVH